MLTAVQDVVLAWRVRGMAFTLANAFVVVAALLVVPQGQQEVPGRLGIYTFVWPLIPAVVAIFLPLVSARTSTSQHRVAPGYTVRRGADLAGFVALTVGAVVWRQDLDAVVLVRNVALFVGLTATCIRVLGPNGAWVLPAATVMVTWLLGTSNGGEPHGWAVLLHGPTSIPAISAAALLAVTGVLGYLTEPARD